MDKYPDPEALYCRLCLDNTIKYPNCVDITFNKCKMYDKILKLFNINMDNSQLSNFICFLCRDQLEDINRFMETVVKNQELLQKTIKEESVTDDENLPILYNAVKVEVLEGPPLLLSSKKKTLKKKKNKETDHTNPYICDICKKSCMSKYSLAMHMRHHIANPSYECPDCDEEFQSIKELKSHKLASHKQNETGGAKIRYYDKVVDISSYLVCELCPGNLTFKTFKLMNDHYLTKHDTRGYVRCCKSKFTTKRSVVIHCDRHLAPSDYMCLICKKVLPHKRALKIHMTIHTSDEEKPLKCSYCPKRFSYYSQLNTHVKTTHDKPFSEKVICPQCNKTYGSQFLLEQHIQRVHDKNKELLWICEICGKGHYDKADLKSHIKFKHTNNTLTKCEICGKVVKVIERHLKIHREAELDINCQVCGKSLPSNTALYAHMVVHKEKQFNCKTCGEFFRRKEALHDHMSQHTGIPRHFCNYCDRTFNNSGNKYKHIKQAHYDEHQKQIARKRSMKGQCTEIGSNKKLKI